MTKPAYLYGVEPFSDEVNEYDRQFARFSAIKKLMKIQGVKTRAYARAGNNVYLSTDYGPWKAVENGKLGRCVDFDEVYDNLVAAGDDADFCYQLFFEGEELQLNEIQMNRWLLSLWNVVNIQIQQSFGLLLPVSSKLVETPISRIMTDRYL